jgi:hypothetical protein
VYDQEFTRLYTQDAKSVERLLAVRDEDPWMDEAAAYPLANGKAKLCQPSLGHDSTWTREPRLKEIRYENLMKQAAQANLAVKNRLLRGTSPLSEREMKMKWPTMTRLGGVDMLHWGSGECFDPGLKSAKRLKEKADVKYDGNYSLLKDVARFSMYYPDPASLFKGLQALRSSFKCVKIENRFRNPTVLGWRDVTVILEVTLNAHEWGPGGARHLVEVQLQLCGYADAREHAHVRDACI